MLKMNPTATVDEAPGFRRMFRASRLLPVVFIPIEASTGDAPSMPTCLRGSDRQAEAVARWARLRGEVHAASLGAFKPFVRSLYVDPAGDAHLAPALLHLGFRAGAASWNRARPEWTTRSHRSIEAGPTGEHR